MRLPIAEPNNLLLGSCWIANCFWTVPNIHLITSQLSTTYHSNSGHLFYCMRADHIGQVAFPIHASYLIMTNHNTKNQSMQGQHQEVSGIGSLPPLTTSHQLAYPYPSFHIRNAYHHLNTYTIIHDSQYMNQTSCLAIHEYFFTIHNPDG